MISVRIFVDDVQCLKDFVDVQIQDNPRDLVELDGGMIIFQFCPKQ
jgi:hypothetical protein